MNRAGSATPQSWLNPVRLVLTRWGFPLFLFWVCVLAYGLWISRLGFYWDDFPITWIARTYGGEGLARYFSTNRPFWGLLYRLTTPLLGANPLAWQVFALFWRWVSGLLLWQLVKLTWPRHEDAARWAAALFVVYPGFSEQYISVVYSHFFIVLSSFLGSLGLMVRAMRAPGPAWRWIALACLLSAVNLLCMEYFFLLDLLRLPLLWVALAENKAEFRAVGLPGKLRKLLTFYLPFLAIFLGVVAWRSFFFGFHTYQPTFTSELRAAALAAVWGLAGRMLGDIWLTAGLAWVKAFDFSGLSVLTLHQVQVYWLTAGVGVLGAAVFFLLAGSKAKPRPQDWLGLLLTALLGLAAAGGPFWLTGLPVGLNFHTDRFTISFMLGACLLGVGLVLALPLPSWVKVLPLALVLGFSIAQQYRSSLSYYRDWSTQRILFWQMTWRMPGLEPGTILLFNELPVEHYSDNSLTAPLNWIYAPQNFSQQMDYVLYYPTVRLGSGLPRLEKGLPVVQDYLAAEFRGDTSRVVVLYAHPPGCLRVMDPEVEEGIWLVPPLLRETLKLSTSASILPEGSASPPPGLYGGEPEHNWCYYFEKADLARQQKDWAAAAQLGDQAFALKDYPNDPVERFPFIEAYAHVGSWARALELTRDSKEIAPLYAQLGCKLWARIERETQPDVPRNAAVKEARAVLGCGQ